jgi:cell division protein FtsZ
MQAERGMQELLDSVDTLIVIPNEKLLAVAKDAGFFESFRIADDVLRQGVQGISDIITIPGVINRDFADVKTTMAGMGYSVMGTAVRSGPDRAKDAAMAAMASPLLEAGAIDGARGILINVTGSSSLKLNEVIAASTLIQNAAHEDANIIFGAVLDESMGEEVKITVIATGFREQHQERRDRMMAESTLLTSRQDGGRYEVAPPRIERRAETAPFASEVKPPVIPPVVNESREIVGVTDVPDAREQTFREKFPGFAAERDRTEMTASQRIQAYTDSVPHHIENDEPEFGVDDEAEAPTELSGSTRERAAALERALNEVTAEPLHASPSAPGAYVPHDPAEPKPELVPVPASVFDDDFFRKPNEELRSASTTVGEEGAAPAWPEARVPTFAGYAAEVPAETDELDIPAFLRRNH